jgi:hypothetical protein
MFTPQQKHDIATKIQAILKETVCDELPDGEINFILHVDGDEYWSWANIRNNNAAGAPIPEPVYLIQNLSSVFWKGDESD